MSSSSGHPQPDPTCCGQERWRLRLEKVERNEWDLADPRVQSEGLLVRLMLLVLGKTWFRDRVVGEAEEEGYKCNL